MWAPPHLAAAQPWNRIDVPNASEATSFTVVLGMQSLVSNFWVRRIVLTLRGGTCSVRQSIQHYLRGCTSSSDSQYELQAKNCRDAPTNCSVVTIWLSTC
jgi:hypothetical protein